MRTETGIPETVQRRQDALRDVEIGALREVQEMVRTLRDPTDAELDEIDARATALVRGVEYARHDIDPANGLRLWPAIGEPVTCPRWSKSRDLLESIRPPGWMFWQRILGEFSGFSSDESQGGFGLVDGHYSPNERLSELSCILRVRALVSRISAQT